MQKHAVQWKRAETKQPGQNAQPRLPASPTPAGTLLWRAAQRGVGLLLSEAARPVRFLCIGGVAVLFQLGLLDILAHQEWNSALANLTASLLGAEVNFVLSFLFTWRDRRSRSGAKQVLGRWIAYHASITGTLFLSQLLFLATRLVLPQLLASFMGTAGAAVANYELMNRFVFRERAGG